MVLPAAGSLLVLLLLLLFGNGSDSAVPESDDVLRLPSMKLKYDNDPKIVQVRDDTLVRRHHALGHINPSSMVFFTLSELKVGNQIPIYFPKKQTPHFLSKEESNSIPFSLKELPFLLKFFSINPDSPQAKAMEITLKECLILKPIKGETKFCATSLETMLGMAQSVFGPNPSYRTLATQHLVISKTIFQNYTILEVPRQIQAHKMVACHTLSYPYLVLYCHTQESENKVFKVSLKGDNGDLANALAVCHMDTSQWGRGHVSFRVLGTQPGMSEVCHFFPSDHFVMVSMD